MFFVVFAGTLDDFMRLLSITLSYLVTVVTCSSNSPISAQF